MTATETCKCGSTFTLTSRNETAVLIALNAWRRDHRCTVRNDAKAQSQESKP